MQLHYPTPRIRNHLPSGMGSITLLLVAVCCLGCPKPPDSATREAVVVGSSMGPNFLGAHVSATCQQCGIEFVAGFLDDEHHPQTLEQFRSGWLVCPNCGHNSDQHAMTSRPGDSVQVVSSETPQRWSVVAFERTTLDEGVARVERGIKRVVGLPGETISIEQGNVYLVEQDESGKPASNPETEKASSLKRLLRKNFSQQRATAILVHDSAFDDGEDRWSIDDTTSTPVRTPVRTPESASLIWRTFQPKPCYSVGDASLQRGIEDSYGCNQSLGRNLNRTDEILVSFEMGSDPPEKIAVEFNIRGKVYGVVLDLSDGELTLGDQSENDDPKHESTCRWNSTTPARRIDVSSIDQQILIAIDGQPIFAKSIAPGAGAVAKHPIRIGIPTTTKSLDRAFQRIRLFRDLFYLPSLPTANAKGKLESRNLVAGAGFVLLGDNVPVSFDSRHWETTAVKRNSILGVVKRRTED